MENKKKRPALFLDRDGTMIYDPGYISRPKKIQFLYGLRETIRAFRKRGFYIIVITNQSGINRGFLTEEDLDIIHRRIDSKLKDDKPDAYYFCPHLPDEKCLCRKPGTGNIEKAIEDWNIDREKSLIVGDRLSDFRLGEKSKIPSFLMLTGLGYETLEELEKEGKKIEAFAHLKDLTDYFLLK